MLFFRLDFLNMRLKRARIYSVWHEMFKIASISGAPLQTPLRSLRRSLKLSSRKGLLAFGNRNFTPSALAISRRPTRGWGEIASITQGGIDATGIQSKHYGSKAKITVQSKHYMSKCKHRGSTDLSY